MSSCQNEDLLQKKFLEDVRRQSFARMNFLFAHMMDQKRCAHQRLNELKKVNVLEWMMARFDEAGRVLVQQPVYFHQWYADVRDSYV